MTWRKLGAGGAGSDECHEQEDGYEAWNHVGVVARPDDLKGYAP